MPPERSLEAQVAVLANEVQNLRAEIADMRADIRELKARVILDERGIRELCREVIWAESAEDTSNRDSVMRIVTFAVSIGTAVFVIRGGR